MGLGEEAKSDDSDTDPFSDTEDDTGPAPATVPTPDRGSADAVAFEELLSNLSAYESYAPSYEVLLDQQDFHRVFGMRRREFYAQPPSEQDVLRSAVGLAHK